MSDAKIPCGRGHKSPFNVPLCQSNNLCPNCTELLAIRRRVAELEATAGRLQSEVEAYKDCKRLWDAGMESLCEANHALKQEVRILRNAAAEVAAGEKTE